MIAILGAGSLGRLWAASLPLGQVAFVPRPSKNRVSLNRPNHDQPNQPVHYRFQATDPGCHWRAAWLVSRGAAGKKVPGCCRE
ncbi:MAG: hypothetical protein B7X58_11290 [Marinobacter sp. 34-60-7]|nr:MAG: hypothetical protein B7X58_11290 [Marinobacter sp. 34-60-7]